MIINRRKINHFLLSIFIFVCSLMPAESFSLKELFLGLLLLANIDTIISGMLKDRHFIWFGIITPCWMLIVSIMAGGEVVDSIQAVYIFTFIWIPIIAVKYSIDLKKIFINTTYFIAVLTDMFVVLHATNILPLLNNPLAIWMHESGNAQLSYGSVAIFYYVFFLNACPLMLFTLVDALKNQQPIKTIIVLLALMFSGTRANIYLAFTTIIAYLIIYRKLDWKKIVIISFGGVLSIFLLVRLAPTIIEKISTINSVKTYGDNIRAERTAAAIREIFGNIKVLLIGMGANVPFMANGILNYASEMSYIELWRMFGVVSFVLVIYMLVYLLLKNRKDPNTIAYIAYLVTCAFDPFLLTSTGFLMVMYMFYLYKIREKESNSYDLLKARPGKIIPEVLIRSNCTNG